MASVYSQIKRAVTYLRDFLSKNQEEYHRAAIDLNFGLGWARFSYDDEVYALMANLEGNFYDGLYPKWLEEHPATDRQNWTISNN